MTTGDPPIPPQWDSDRQLKPSKEDVLELVASVKSHDDHATALQAAIEELTAMLHPDMMAKSIKFGNKATIEDSELMNQAVKRLYDGVVELGKHDGTMWLGAKIGTWIGTSLIGLGLAIAVYFVKK